LGVHFAEAGPVRTADMVDIVREANGKRHALTVEPRVTLLVVIGLSCERTARVRDEFTRRPSTQTVQAPQRPWSLPCFVPVR
jgi:hypothetical protein